MNSSHISSHTHTHTQVTLMLLDSATVSLVVVRCVILPWRWEVQMEAVVDMTPRLRIPSSSRKKQRSLSPFHPLFFLSLCWNVPLYSLFPLPVYPPPHHPPMLWAPIQTPTSSPHLPKWPLASPKISHLLVCAWNNEEADTHTHKHTQAVLTPLCLRTATHGCRWRRSTRPQRDGARLTRPSGRAERRRPARLLWSPSGPWRSQGSAQTHDLRGHRAGPQMNYFQLSTSDVWCLSLPFLFDTFGWWFLPEVGFF